MRIYFCHELCHHDLGDPATSVIGDAVDPLWAHV